MAQTGRGLEPLAIVGFSFKFPGAGSSTDAFWKMLMETKCVATEFPSSRFKLDVHYHPDRSRSDSFSMCGGHFLSEDVSRFDAPFFRVSPAEAEVIDPQQRLILEATYHALENAGLPLESTAGSKTSVFIGSSSLDYVMLQAKDPLSKPAPLAAGMTRNMLANRVSSFFDFHGPSASVDTACSSGLMAIELACQSIWCGDANMVCPPYCAARHSLINPGHCRRQQRDPRTRVIRPRHTVSG